MEKAGELAVEARGICRRFGRRWALINVDLAVPAGSAMMVVGRNGSGKSTLLRVLSTAISADRGTARIHGADVRSSRGLVRERVALLGHYLYHYESLSALENLQVKARHLGIDSSRPSLIETLSRVDLAGRADDPVATFSAGMRKRLALAGVILQRAKVVMLDEPFGQLDPPGFRFVDALVRSMRESGVTVLVATHQLERSAAFCETALVLDEGEVRWTGPVDELLRRGGVDELGAEGV